MVINNVASSARNVRVVTVPHSIAVFAAKETARKQTHACLDTRLELRQKRVRAMGRSGLEEKREPKAAGPGTVFLLHRARTASSDEQFQHEANNPISELIFSTSLTAPFDTI